MTLARDLTRAFDPALIAQDCGITPDPWQATLLRERPRRSLLLCSRQSGKSTVTALMRTMTNEQRRDALKKFEYRQAALESLPELSGLGPTQHDTLREEILAKAFPEDIAGIKDGTSALEIAERARAAATAAIENELKAAGSTVEEPLPPAEPKPWI